MVSTRLGPTRTPFDAGLAVGLGTLVVLVVDAASGVQLTGAYATAAIVASMLTDARRTAVVAAAAVAAALLGGVWQGNVGTRDWAVRAAICVVLATLAVLSAALRDRREARLRRITVIAEPALARYAWPPGARLLMYTDGLVEARDRTGLFFPLDRHLPQLRAPSLEESLEALVASLLAHTGPYIKDDLALVLAERRVAPQG